MIDKFLKSEDYVTMNPAQVWEYLKHKIAKMSQEQA